MLRLQDKSSATKDTLSSLVGVIGTALLGLSFTVLAARLLKPELFGVYSTLVAFVTIIATIGDLGLTSAVMSLVPKKGVKSAQYLSAISWMTLSVSIIISVVSIICAYFSNINILYVGILSSIYIIQSLFLAVFNAKRKFIFNSLTQIIDSFVKLSLTLYFIYYWGGSIHLLLIANIISSTLSVVFANIIDSSFLFTQPKLKTVNEIIKFSKWVAFSRIFTLGISRIDIILLNYLASSYYAGIYSATTRFGLLFTLFSVAIGNVANQRMSTIKSRTHLVNLTKKLLVVFTLISVMMILVAIFSKPLILLVYGREYIESAPVLVALSLAMIPYVFSIATTGPILYTFNNSMFYSYLTMSQFVIILAMNYILIPPFKALGPAMSLGFANLFLLVVSSIKLSKSLNELDQ